MRAGFLLVAVLGAATPSWSAANEVPCADSELVVVAQVVVDQESVCSTARKTLTFLESIGLEIRDSVTIKLIDGFKGGASRHAIGEYNSRSREISLLRYDSALAASFERPAFSLTMNRELWRSYVGHELAHVAALEHFAPGVPTFTASEYIAAITQFAMLSQAAREKILKNYSGVEAFDNENAISQLYYLMDPCMFAVKAYLHYLKPENGALFIDRLIYRGLEN